MNKKRLVCYCSDSDDRIERINFAKFIKKIDLISYCSHRNAEV